MPAFLQQQAQIGNGNRMCEVSKVGMPAKLMKQRIENGRIFLIREHGKEKQGSGQRIENTCRTKLMCRVNGFKRRITVLKEQLVVVNQKGNKAAPKENANADAMLFHECHEIINMNCQPAAQHKYEYIVHDPVVQAIQQKRLQQGGIRQTVNEKVQGSAEAGPVVKNKLGKEQSCQSFYADAADNLDPKRHQQVEPEQDNEKIELVFGIAEKQENQQAGKIGEPDTIQPAVMKQVKDRPYKIGNKNRLSPAFHEIFKRKRSRQIQIIEQAERGNEEENRYAETRGNLKKCNKIDIG